MKRKVHILNVLTYKGFPGDSDGKEFTCNAGDALSIPELGRSPGEGTGKLLQYSCLENPIDKEFLTDYSPQGHESTGLSD